MLSSKVNTIILKGLAVYFFEVYNLNNKFTRYDKVEIKKKVEFLYPFQSFSYAYPYCILIDSNTKIGVDIENKKIRDDVFSIFLNKQETLLLKDISLQIGLNHLEVAQMFWTYKEALGKYKGTGFKNGFFSVDICSDLSKENEEVCDILLYANSTAITLCGVKKYLSKDVADFFLKNITVIETSSCILSNDFLKETHDKNRH